MNEQSPIEKIESNRDYIEAWKKAKAEIKDVDFIKSVNVPPVKGDYIKNIPLVDIFSWLPLITQEELDQLNNKPETLNVKVTEVGDPNDPIMTLELEGEFEQEFAGILEKKNKKIDTRIKKIFLESYGNHKSN